MKRAWRHVVRDWEKADKGVGALSLEGWGQEARSRRLGV